MKKRSQLLGRIALVVLTVWALAVIVPDIRRVFYDYGTLGLSANNNGHISDISGPPASDSGLHRGDRIDLDKMKCRAGNMERCKNLLAVFGGMGGLQYVALGRPVSLDILRGSGASQRSFNVELMPAAAPLTTTTRVILMLAELVGIAFILLAAILVWQSPSVMTWGFFLYAMWFNPGQYFAFYAFLQRWPVAVLAQEALQSIAQGLGYVGFVLFALRFPRNETEPRWKKVEFALPWVAVILIALQLASFGTAFGYHTELLTRASFVSGYVIDAFVIYALLARRRALEPVEYQRIRWVIWGCLIGLPAFIFADSNEATTLWTDYLWRPFFNNWTPPEALLDSLFLLNGFLAGAVFEAVRRHRVVNVSFHIRRGTAAIAVSLGALLIIEYFHRNLEEWLNSHGLEAWVYTALAVFLTFSVGRSYEFLVHWLDRMFNEQFERAKRKLNEIAQQILHSRERSEIDRLLTHEPCKSLNLTSAAVFRKEGDAFYRRGDGLRWNGGATKLQANHPLVDECIAASKPVHLHDYDKSWLEGMPEGDASPVLAVVITNNIETFAIALYGAHETGDDLDVLERGILADLGTQAAVAYEHVIAMSLARQVGSLRARLRRLRGYAHET